MITPSAADMKGPLAADIERYLATEKSSAHDRVRLFRLAWDVAISSFGSRQVLYERFFALARAAGRSRVCCVTSPANRGSLAFHVALGFEPSEPKAGYDGPGEDRVVLTRSL